MFKMAFRWITQLFLILLLVISLILILTRNPSFVGELNAFIDSSDTCTTKPCFLGIVPGETEALKVSDILRDSAFIAELDIVDVVTGLEYLHWNWTGEQPSIFNEAGYLRYRKDTVAYLTLKPDLNLGQLQAFFGNPDAINDNNYYIRLYYFERGIILRFIPDCGHIQYSETWIDIDIRITAPIDKPSSLSDAILAICGKKQYWP